MQVKAREETLVRDEQRHQQLKEESKKQVSCPPYSAAVQLHVCAVLYSVLCCTVLCAVPLLCCTVLCAIQMHFSHSVLVYTSCCQVQALHAKHAHSFPLEQCAVHYNLPWTVSSLTAVLIEVLSLSLWRAAGHI